jgi:two-component system, NtrC family, response regulator
MNANSRPIDLPRVMFVEDDPAIQRQLRWSFTQYKLLLAGDRASALAQLAAERPPVVVLDLGLPPEPDGVGEGMATLEAVLALAPATKIIVMTGNSDRPNAVRAVGLGAYDFYQKPIDIEILGLIIDRAIKLSQLEAENRRNQERASDTPLAGVVTSSPEMLRLCRLLEKVAPADVTVLLLGESGTGKEVLANALHALSPRASKPFIAINCAAIPENLLESELFGHEKGAFTGAIKQTKGKIELASSGTLFLDEIGDLPLPLQVKLLRFLQERIVERVGGRVPIPVDVRIICATHRELPDLVQTGAFREDLYYRLDEFTVRIPPLRDRPGDAHLLAQFFLTRFNADLGKALRGFSGDALSALAAHEWPGNVRELQNRVKRAVIMADGPLINATDLNLVVSTEDCGDSVDLRRAREEAERMALQRALLQEQGNVSRAARLLGVSRPTLYDLMRHHKLKI